MSDELKWALVGGAVVGAIFLIARSSGAASSAALSQKLPPTPGTGATTTNIGIMAGLPFSMTRTVWAGTQSGASGSFYLIQNASNPNDWALQFIATGAAKNTAILNQGSTANSALIAQAIASGQ